MKKHLKSIIAALLLLVVGVVCAACSQNKAPAKLYTYTIVNETGSEVTGVIVKDDNSPNKAEVKYEGKGMANGGKGTVSISAVPVKDGNPSLTVSYTIGGTEYSIKVTSAAAVITLTPEGAQSGAFDVNAPQK